MSPPPKAEWLIEALSASHQSKKIKEAARELLTCHSFTVNLNAFGDIAGPGRRNTLWAGILMPRLNARLDILGNELVSINKATRVKEELGFAAIDGCFRWHVDHPAGMSRSDVRQDNLMPTLAAAFDFEDWQSRPEHIYGYALVMLGAAIDAEFGAKVEAAAAAAAASALIASGRDFETGSVNKHASYKLGAQVVKESTVAEEHALDGGDTGGSTAAPSSAPTGSARRSAGDASPTEPLPQSLKVVVASVKAFGRIAGKMVAAGTRAASSTPDCFL